MKISQWWNFEEDIFIIKVLGSFQEMEPQTGTTRKNINSIQSRYRFQGLIFYF